MVGVRALHAQPPTVPADSLITRADHFIDSLRSTRQLADDPSATSFVRRAVDDLLATGEYPDSTFSVHIQNSLTANAFIMPNGAIVVTSGLLLRLETRAELLMILGHELGHYLLSHFSGPQQMTLEEANLRSLIQEYEADSVGLAFLLALGEDPQAAACALEKLPPDANGLIFDMPFLQLRLPRRKRITHPPTPRRIELLGRTVNVKVKADCPGDGSYTTHLRNLRNETRWDMLLDAKRRNNRTIQIITIDSLLDNTAVKKGSGYYGHLRFQQAEAIIHLLRGGNASASQDLQQGKAVTFYRNNDLASEREYYAIKISTLIGSNGLREAHQLFSPLLLRNLNELEGMEDYRTEALRLRGLYLDHIGHYVEARAVIQEYLALEPTNPARRYAASLLNRMPKKNRKKPLY